MPNSIAISPRDETLGHAIISKSLTELMRQNNRRFWMYIIARWWFYALICVAYVELITALSTVWYLWNSPKLMAISTRVYLKHTRWICRNVFPGDGFKWIGVVNLLGNTTYHFQSLVYNARISWWGWPTTNILQFWAELADGIISRLQFYIAKHALRGNRKFKVVRLC